MKNVEILDSKTKYAVIRMPDRAYPGIVIQGDALHIIVDSLKLIISNISQGKLDEIEEEIAMIYEDMLGAKLKLEDISRKNGIDLPY